MITHKKALVFGALVRLSDWQRALMAYRRGDMDGLELRLDAFSPLQLVKLHSWVVETKKLPPLLITVRSRSEGGFQSLSFRERKNRFKLFLPYASFLDCELRSKSLISWLRHQTKGKKKLILSYHNFKKVPSFRSLETVLRHSLSHRPFLTKIAVNVHSSYDVLSLMAFLEKYQQKGLILIGMGEKGEVSRVLFPLVGSRISFGHLGFKSAPGQLPVKTLRSLIRRLT